MTCQGYFLQPPSMSEPPSCLPMSGLLMSGLVDMSGSEGGPQVPVAGLQTSPGMQMTPLHGLATHMLLMHCSPGVQMTPLQLLLPASALLASGLVPASIGAHEPDCLTVLIFAIGASLYS